MSIHWDKEETAPQLEWLSARLERELALLVVVPVGVVTLGLGMSAMLIASTLDAVVDAFGGLRRKIRRG